VFVARDTVITVVLVIASAILAIGLFVAGAVWKAKTPRKPASPLPNVSLRGAFLKKTGGANRRA
jgi:hypothetical protein